VANFESTRGSVVDNICSQESTTKPFLPHQNLGTHKQYTKYLFYKMAFLLTTARTAFASQLQHDDLKFTSVFLSKLTDVQQGLCKELLGFLAGRVAQLPLFDEPATGVSLLRPIKGTPAECLIDSEVRRGMLLIHQLHISLIQTPIEQSTNTEFSTASLEYFVCANLQQDGVVRRARNVAPICAHEQYIIRSSIYMEALLLQARHHISHPNEKKDIMQ
jgi:hypothetical protein